MRLVIVLIGLLAGCGTARRGPTVIGALELDDHAARGEEVFMRHCHQCHPFGEGGLGPAINNRRLPGWAIKLQTRLGAGAMPSFHQDEISKAELDAVVAWLEVLKEAEPIAVRRPALVER